MLETYLCSFASPSLNLSANRFLSEAKKLELYKKIKIFGKKDLSDEIKLRIQNFKYPIINMRLYGYACWKPYVVKKFFEQIPNNSILQYTDIGCHLNIKGVERLKEYIEICDKKNVLVFQYRNPDWKHKFNQLKFQKYYEYEYNKADTWLSMGVGENSRILYSEQIWSGCFFIKKNKIGKQIIDEWIRFSKQDHLINDDDSKSKNHASFKEHRHDQSIFSLICKKYKTFSLSASECEWAEKNNKRTWEHVSNFPILAKRDKKYNIFKRFFNRQIRNLKRRLESKNE